MPIMKDKQQRRGEGEIGEDKCQGRVNSCVPRVGRLEQSRGEETEDGSDHPVRAFVAVCEGV